MASTPLNTLIARCRVLCRPRPQASDADLLRRFFRQRDPAAFEELLERYAPLVWGVCRRTLTREADREDAFQATFLAFVRQAGSLDPGRPPGAWLHTVALRVARKAQIRVRRQQTVPAPLERSTAGDVADDVSSRELCRAVDEEIERLPLVLRWPVILCCLEGRTRDEAAEMLGCSVAAVKSRLERGRGVLRRRLERRGVQLPAAFLVLGLTGERVRASLWAKTVRLPLNSPPPAVAALAEAGLRTLAFGKLKLALAVLLITGAAGMIGQALTAKAPQTPAPPAQAKRAAEPKKPAAPQVRTDRHGDPLPDGATARLGTVRWRHGDFVHALAYSPDGKKIVTTGVGRALVLWDAATGKELWVSVGPGQPRGAAFSPDGKLIATTQRWGQLWDTATGKMLRELKSLQTAIVALAFAPDGQTLATANSDGSIHLWDPANAEEKRHINCEQGGVEAVAYSPDGATLASGGSDGTIRLWDPATGKERRRIVVGKKPIRSIVFSPDGKQLAAGSDDDSPRLWDVATGRHVRTFAHKQAQFCPLAFSPDGKLLAAGYSDNSFRLWDVASGEEKRHWHAGAGRTRSLAFSPDGKTLATAVLWDGCLRLWDVETGRERDAVEGHHGPITLLRFAADTKTLISAGFDRNLLWWDLASQTPRRRFAWTTPSFSGFALSPDGNILAVGDHETHEIWLWDVRTGKSTKLPIKHKNWIQTLTFSPDGRLLASSGRDDAIHVWDMQAGKELWEIKGFELPSIVMGSLFSPDGKTLAAATMGLGNERTTRLFDIVNGKPYRVLDKIVGDMPAAFSPDGKVLATAGDPPRRGVEPLIRLWDMTTGKELCRYSGHGKAAGAAAFSPDGKLMVSGGAVEEDNSIHVWEAASGRLIRRFEGHHSWVFAVTFTTDGLTVASSAGDSTILVWDITGRRADGRWHKKPLTPHELDDCWIALANEDATKAYEAVWTLVAAPEQAVPFLQEHLRPAPRSDAKAVARLLADLDSSDFTVRRKATQELGDLGEAIVPDLRRALEAKPALEARRRIQQLLDQARGWNGERLRDHRAVQALEHIGTQPARQVLEALAAGAPEVRLTEEAKAALQRSLRNASAKRR